MSTEDPFQELVDSLRRVLLRPAVTVSPPPACKSSPSPSTSSPPVPSSPMARPAPYSGRAEECNGFLLQCSLIFTMQPTLYPTDQSKIAFIILYSQVQPYNGQRLFGFKPGRPRKPSSHSSHISKRFSVSLTRPYQRENNFTISSKWMEREIAIDHLPARFGAQTSLATGSS
ncbi:hypothetical protein M9458_051753 [Cirrhinus mrigala]|uniref:Uncharacterized protein n=1 Tax=Cirrhinus mrigala TaxID=683832 RepID=A0ABD0MSB4_CIRMR